MNMIKVGNFNISIAKVAFWFLLVFSSMFYGLICLQFVHLVNEYYIFLIAPILAFVIALVFFYDRYIFFLLVILSRASLDAAFNAIKLGSFGLGAILNALVLIIALMTFLEKPVKLSINTESLKLSWGLFLGLAFISIFYSPSAVYGFKYFISYMSYAAMFLLGLHLVKTTKDFEKWIKAIALSSLIPVLYSAYCMVFGGNGLVLYKFEGMRLQGTFPHANAFAPYLALITPLCFYLYKSKVEYVPKAIRHMLPVYICGLIVMLVMTKTRSAWAVTYLFFLIYGLLYERKFLLFIIAAPFLALLVPEVQDRLLDLTKGNDYGSTGYERMNSLLWRIQIWQDSISWMGSSNYLLGRGLASFLVYSQSFGRANAFQMQDFDINAHNIYVQALFEQGVIGLIIMLFLFFAHYRTLFSLINKNRFLVFTMASIYTQVLVQGLVDNLLSYLIVEWYMWFMMGLTISYVDKCKPTHTVTKK